MTPTTPLSVTSLALAQPPLLFTEVIANNSWVQHVYRFAIMLPLEHVYRRGWWRNLPAHDICAQLTHHTSDFWLQHPDACADVLYNNLDSWAVWAQLALYVWVLRVVWQGAKTTCGWVAKKIT